MMLHCHQPAMPQPPSCLAPHCPAAGCCCQGKWGSEPRFQRGHHHHALPAWANPDQCQAVGPHHRAGCRYRACGCGLLPGKSQHSCMLRAWWHGQLLLSAAKRLISKPIMQPTFRLTLPSPVCSTSSRQRLWLAGRLWLPPASHQMSVSGICSQTPRYAAAAGGDRLGT